MPANDQRRPGQSGTVRLQDFAVFKYVNDWVTNVRDVWMEQFNDLSATWEHIQKGEYPTSQWIPDAARIWSSWAKGAEKLGMLPLTWARSSQGLPMAVFVLDEAAETTDPEEITVSIRRGDGQLRCTPLHGGDGDGAIPRTAVKVSRGGSDSIGIKLVGIDRLRGPDRKGLPPGHYAGAVYMKENHHNVPVALVQVIVEGRTDGDDGDTDDGGDDGDDQAARPAAAKTKRRR